MSWRKEMIKILKLKKISWKLTIIYSAIFSLILILLSAGILYGLRYYLVRQSELQVNTSSSATIKNIFHINDSSSLTGNTVEKSELAIKNFLPDLSDPELLSEAVGNSELNIILYDSNGKIVNSTVKFKINDIRFNSNLGKTQVLETQNRHMVFKNEILISNNKIIGYVQVAYNMQKEYDFMKVLLVFMGLADFFGILLSLFTGYFISRRILKPIDKITKTAKNISISDLTSKIETGETDDELNRLAITFNEMLERLRISFEKQNQFVSDASHELRTPISVIQGYASLIDRWGKNDPKVLDEGVSAIKNETENMKKLIERLLFLAKADEDKINIQKENININDLIDEVICESKIISPEHQFISKSIGKIILFADRNLIKQMLRALLDNSIKFTPENGMIVIDILKSKDGIQIEVKDTGIGIPAEELDKIFDRFAVLDKSRSKEKGGSGLGLSIVKWIVEAHNGKITVESSLGIGTTMKIIFFNTSNF
jgi:two-component system sensor histidine kinase ArlS